MTCLKRVRSRELRHGYVYIDCDCYHRNGLQHDCPRSNCGGNTNCTIHPWPKCDLGSYFQQKWKNYNEYLDELPATSYCGPWKPGASRPSPDSQTIAKVPTSNKMDECKMHAVKIPKKLEKPADNCVKHPLPKLEKPPKVICNDRKPVPKPVAKIETCSCGPKPTK